MNIIFSKGDLCVCRGVQSHLNIEGRQGTIIEVFEDEDKCLIQFDEKFSGKLHDGDGRGMRGYCWFVTFDKIIPLDVDDDITYSTNESMFEEIIG